MKEILTQVREIYAMKILGVSQGQLQDFSLAVTRTQRIFLYTKLYVK